MSIGIGLALSPVFGGNVGWWQPGASIDMDFAGNRIFGPASFTSALAITRASAGTAQSASGDWTQFSSGALRITDKGFLIEESRTNGIRNNSMQGAGAGGALPTNWATGGFPAGLTVTCSTAGTENGIDSSNITVSGTAGSSADGFIRMENSQVIAATVGQAWTNSFFLKNISGTMPTTYCRIRERDVSGNQLAVLSTTLTVAASSAALGNSRQSLTATTGNASTAFVMPTIEFTFVNGQSYNFTFRIGWPQCELGGFATSPIRTTSAAVTRAADVVTLNNPTNYVSVSSGSQFIELTPLLVSGGGTISVSTLSVDGNNRQSAYINGSNGTYNFTTRTGGVNQYFLASTNAMVAGTSYKTAMRWNANDSALRVPTALVSPANNTSNSQPTGTPTIYIGSFTGSSQFLNGYIRRIAFFSTPQSDAALAAMVA